MDPKILREAALAYQAVYDEDLRQELEEQQDFENWVNSLVEEGYDLSEYTWEEIYEVYIDEALGSEFIQRGGIGGALQRAQARAQKDGGASNRAWLGNKVKGFFDAQTSFVQRGGIGGALQRAQARAQKDGGASNRAWLGRQIGLGGSQTKPTPSSTPSKFAGARDAAFKKAAAIKGSPVVGSKPSGGSSAPAAKPATPAAARPAASAPTAKPAPTSTAAAKPAPSAGQTGDKTKDMQTWAKANPSLAAKVKPGQSGYGAVQQAKAATGGSAAAKPAANLNTSSITKTAFSSSTPALSKPLSTPSTSSTSSTATPTAAAKPTPTPVKKPMGSSKPGSIVSGFDMFDVVKGYLIDEGYAETEQAAIAIMANMSEEWKLEIISEMSPTIQKLTSRPSVNIGGGSSSGPQKPSTTSSAVRKPTAQSNSGLTPMQRLQRPASGTIQ